MCKQNGGLLIKVQLLGNILIRNGQETHHVRAKNVRICLALLALEAGRPVRSSTLASELWGENPPREISNALQATIARIRTLMKRSGGCRKDLRSVPDGYVLDVPSGHVDALAFRAEAQEILYDPQAAIDRYTKALDMWSGPALMGGCDGPRCFNEATSLEELRLQVLERLAIRRLMDQDHVRAAHDIDRLTIERPLNEHYCELRMMALYYLGQHAAALKEFHRFAEAVDREMGMLPSRRAQDLYSDILTDAKDRIDRRMHENEPSMPDVSPILPHRGNHGEAD